MQVHNGKTFQFLCSEALGKIKRDRDDEVVRDKHGKISGLISASTMRTNYKKLQLYYKIRFGKVKSMEEETYDEMIDCPAHLYPSTKDELNILATLVTMVNENRQVGSTVYWQG